MPTLDEQTALDFPGEITIHYDDDSDLGRAGQGLQSFPLMNVALRARKLEYWLMSPAEQVALVFLLEHLRPKVAIEIGTQFGGSLQALAQFCDRVYSIDIDPDVPKRLASKFPNVEFLTGRSDDLLPPLIDRLQCEGTELSFALVDGDHSTDGVRKDLDNLLRFRPTVPLYIVMHDSSNPVCREGLRRAKWAANPCVHAVELDFVPGTVFRGKLWGGLALGILLPHERSGRFEITARSELTLRSLRSQQTLGLLPRAARKVKRMLLGTH